MVRASVFALVALMGAWSPFAVMGRKVYPTQTPHEVPWVAVWLSALFVVVLCGGLAWRVAREAFPPEGTAVFPVLPVGNLTVVDVLVSPVALLLLLSLGLMPRMWAEPLRGGDGLLLFIIVPMAAALLLWRPTYHVAPGQPIVRWLAGPWLPWKKVLPLRPTLTWRDFWAGRPRRQIGWSLHAVMGRYEFFLDMVPLEASDELKERVEREWSEFFSRVKVGTAEEVAAAFANDKPVKPWHLLAAIFGLPATPLAVAFCFQKHYDGTSMGVALLAVTVVGGLSLWFLSRFLSEKVLTAAIAVLAAVSIAGVLSGRSAAQAAALSNRLGYQIADVCDGKPATVAPSASEPVRFAYQDGGRHRATAPEGSEWTAMPRAVGCIAWSRGEPPVATVTLRASATAEVLTTRTFGAGTNLDAMAAELQASVR